MPSPSFLLHLLAVGSFGLLNVYGAPVESDVSNGSNFAATNVLATSTHTTSTHTTSTHTTSTHTTSTHTTSTHTTSTHTTSTHITSPHTTSTINTPIFTATSSLMVSSTVTALSISPSFIPVSSEVEVPADPISKYTVDFFTDNIMPHFKQKQDNNCLFYANDKLSHIARRYAKLNGKVSIWDLWLDDKCTYYKTTTKLPSSPLREIMANKAQQEIYFRHMSEAFAKHCTGDVVVMTRKAKVDDIPQDGIWGQVEQKTLKQRNSGCKRLKQSVPKVRA